MIRVVVAIAISTSVARAAPPNEVTVEQAIELYRARSPRRAASLAQVDVTAADVVGARLYPNPTVGVSGGRTAVGDTAGPGWQYTLDLDIPILIGHRRDRRERAARAHVDAARADADADSSTAELSIRARFAALLAAQQRRAALVVAVDEARALRTLVAGRSAAGAASPYAVERVDLAIATLSSRLDDATVADLAASRDLAAGVGIAGWQPRAVVSAAAPSTTTIDPAHPVLVADQLAQRAARADEALAHAEGLPVPSLGIQSFVTNDPSGLGLTLGISVPLPLFDRNQGVIARAHAEAHRLELERAAHAQELAIDLERYTAVLAARRAALARFRADALDRLPRIRSMAETAFRSGQGGIVELLDAFDAMTEAKLREIDLAAAVSEAELAVRAAMIGR